MANVRAIEVFIKLKNKICHFYRLAKNSLLALLFDPENTIYTYIEYHLGDNLTHICYLRRLASDYANINFKHYCKTEYISELNFYTADLNNISIEPLQNRILGAANAWKNYQKYWEGHAFKNIFHIFYKEFYDQLSEKLGLSNPMLDGLDFIFDEKIIRLALKGRDFKSYDWLVVNSTPLSSQFTDANNSLDEFCIELAKKNSIITTKKVASIPCTTDLNMSLLEIAGQSMSTKYQLMISTGPSWLVLNGFNISNSKGIYILCENEIIAFSEKIKMFKSTQEFISYYLGKIQEQGELQ